MTFKCSFMTFNIRHDHGPSSPNTILAPPPSEPLQDTSGELPWAIRKFKVADTILFYQPDIVGLQEPVYHQVVDLHILVGDDYDWIGVGREDGKQEGEYTAILYKKDLFTVLDWKTLWLSDTPEEVGSKGWGAKHPRTATIARFKANASNGEEFSVINTHFDHVSEDARKASATLILQQAIQELDTTVPVILLGDFNSTEDEAAYQELTGHHGHDNRTWAHLQALNEQAAQSFARTTGKPVRTTENSLHLPTHRVFRRGQFMAQQQQQQEQPTVFADTRYELATRLSADSNNVGIKDPARLSGPYGHDATFTSFGEPQEKDNANRRIDYVMYLSPSTINVKVLTYGVLNNQFDDGCLISDHRPVLSRLAWTPL
ncbi:Endonuclease/exonuclease/phosphatase [Absidia repens]|uniref:Endonuclease/exonuclease/phosphatase n=1 Tax=Absidia repens TaxID=90262 RepID=A0A1X2HYJ2_9FUNG|nr:Endonuclease/exonuclease/phosphatase [Absidia repens]